MSLNNAKNVNVSFLHIQQGSEESERFAFYGMFWGWFESPKARWKVLQWTCASGEKWIWIRSFKRGTKYSFCLRGCKNIRGQSCGSKKTGLFPGIGASVLKPADLATSFLTSNFDCWCFCSLLIYKIPQYLIWKIWFISVWSQKPKDLTWVLDVFLEGQSTLK